MKKALKFLFKAGIILIYIALIAILIRQALTPGTESSDISNSVGDKFNEVVTDIQKPEAEFIKIEGLSIGSIIIGKEKHEGNELNMFIGQSGTVNSTVTPSNASNKSLNYSSSDEDTVYVYPDGKITAKGIGSATITVTSAENPLLSYEINISVSEIVAEKIKITNLPEELHVGDKHKLELKFTPSNTSVKTAGWESSDPKVISVSKSGTLTAMKEGVATITVTSTSNPELSYSVEITVLPKIEVPIINPESITVKAAEAFGYIGSEIKVTAKLNPTGAEGKVVWYSSDEDIASVSQSGIVTCNKAGVVTITARCGDSIESSVEITVKEILSQTITLSFEGINNDDDKYVIKEGESGKIIATLDENATVLDVFFSSSDESVARINQDGAIEALAGGSTTITVYTSYDGETTEESFTLTVDRITIKDTITNFYYVIRKSIGHFGAFLVLGIFGSLSYYIIFKKTLKGKLIAGGVTLFAGFAVAGITEILQLPYFTEGRHCSFDDVLLDFRGYCCSSIPIYFIIILAHVIVSAINKAKNNK